jgi:hypothetical protein
MQKLSTATPARGSLRSRKDLHEWVAPKSSRDQATRFDLWAEVLNTGTLVASAVVFSPFSPVAFNGTADVLSLRVFTRIGSATARATSAVATATPSAGGPILMPSARLPNSAPRSGVVRRVFRLA